MYCEQRGSTASSAPLKYILFSLRQAQCTAINRYSLSKGRSFILRISFSSSFLVIPAFAAATSIAISVGSPVTFHSPLPETAPRSRFFVPEGAVIAASEQIVPQVRTAVSTFSFIGLTAVSSLPLVTLPLIL